MLVHSPNFPSEESTEITVRLFCRWYRLRQLGKEHRIELVPLLLQEGPHVWLFDNPADPWGSRRRLSMEELGCMVEIAELRALTMGLIRKEPERSTFSGVEDRAREKRFA